MIVGFFDDANTFEVTAPVVITLLVMDFFAARAS